MGLDRTVMFALVAALAVPLPVAGCTCVQGVAAGQEPLSLVQRIQTRGALFDGTALALRTGIVESPEGSVRTLIRDVLFAVHRSWRGVDQDTITVSSSVVANCGSFFQPGMTYLVVGDKDESRVVTGVCDFDFAAGHRTADETLDSLPEPRWVAPPLGQRSIDRELIRVGEPPPDAPPLRRVSMALMARDGFDMAKVGVEVADTAANLEWHGWLTVELAEGVYRVRFTSPSGDSFETDVWVRCDVSSAAPGDCSIVRIFSPPDAWWGDA